MIKVIGAIGCGVMMIGQVLVNSASATTVIQDDYIGGLYYSVGETINGIDYPPGLVSYNNDSMESIGGHEFEIDRMEVNIGADDTTVKIYTNYVNHIGAGGTDLGDLFISNNGWSPNDPTTEDYFGNGEHWEFALVLDDKLSPTGGTASLYELPAQGASTDPNNNPDIFVLADAHNGAKRYGQEVGYYAGGTLIDDPNDTLSWTIFKDDVDGDPTDSNSLFNDFISFTFANNLIGGIGSEGLGFRWTQTCGNDIIEGKAPVPEPATMLLFGTGLAGLIGFRARKKKA